jgi:hypothetical protein
VGLAARPWISPTIFSMYVSAKDSSGEVVRQPIMVWYQFGTAGRIFPEAAIGKTARDKPQDGAGAPGRSVDSYALRRYWFITLITASR